jgi:uncharacterized membrane protein YgcG
MTFILQRRATRIYRRASNLSHELVDGSCRHVARNCRIPDAFRAPQRARFRAGKLWTQFCLNRGPRFSFQALEQRERIVLRLISVLVAAATLAGCAVAPGYGYPYYDGSGYPYYDGYGYGYPYPYAYGYYPGDVTIGFWGGGGGGYYYHHGYWWHGDGWHGGWHGGGWHGGGGHWGGGGSHGGGGGQWGGSMGGSMGGAHGGH